MIYITLNTAVLLSALSKRTLWRRIAAGQLRTLEGTGQGEHARVVLEDVLAMSPLQLGSQEQALIVAADGGEAAAQCELGLLLLEQQQPAEAVGWLQLAARQQHGEAMHQLGRCYIAGLGVEADEALGAGWISRAAAAGHELARHLAHYLTAPDRPALPAAPLNAELDRIERERVLEVLAEVAA
ncbi:MAG: hypothetical protein RBR77_01565 [Thauera sp.]|jgi:hypothetical protein|nr:hypothetical protein [Thauera sp.]